MNSVKTAVVAKEVLNPKSTASGTRSNVVIDKSELIEIDKKISKSGDLLLPSLIVRRNLFAQQNDSKEADDMTRMSEEAILRMQLTEEAKKRYAEKILTQKRIKEEEERKFKEELEAQQQIEIEKSKKAKMASLRALRDRMKEENAMKTEFKKAWEEERRKKELQESLQRLQEEKKLEEVAQREQARIKQMKEWQNSKEKLEKASRSDALKYHAEKIRSLTNRQEYYEIIRREQEEQRMRYLEGRRKLLEGKELEKMAQEQALKEAAIKRTADLRDQIHAKIRMGNFLWHNGSLGFYSDVRAAPVDWIEYEDAAGTPYFYDPVYQVSQYRRPVDANIVHHIDLERAEYDSVYGEGAYDFRQAEIKSKDEYNRLGGSYDHHGVFHPANGYWDENYEWVPYEGYFNEKGKYVKFAKVQGDLSFMV